MFKNEAIGSRPAFAFNAATLSEALPLTGGFGRGIGFLTFLTMMS
jgi:hypothetical protein